MLAFLPFSSSEVGTGTGTDWQAWFDAWVAYIQIGIVDDFLVKSFTGIAQVGRRALTYHER